MAISFTRISWLWMGGKDKEALPNGSLVNSINSLGGEWGLGLRGEPENLRFNSITKIPPSSSNRKAKRKWKSREERSRRIDKEYDMVLVPSDGVGLSGSESDDSDWSIGWLEPHAPNFQSDDEDEDGSFAVLVPCYRNDCQEFGEKNDDVKNLANNYSTGGKEYMEQWLSSLQNF